jgi:hypothetical protein
MAEEPKHVGSNKSFTDKICSLHQMVSYSTEYKKDTIVTMLSVKLININLQRGYFGFITAHSVE